MRPVEIEAHGHCWIAPTYTAPDGYGIGADAQVNCAHPTRPGATASGPSATTREGEA